MSRIADQALTIFANAAVFDGYSSELQSDLNILIEGNRIKEVSDRPIRSSSAEVHDLRGKTLMPGLIDAHVHAVDTGVTPADVLQQPESLKALKAARVLEQMLMRGFTTVRDACGADLGLAAAVEQGLVKGPRLYFVGRALSPTGGHGEVREPYEDVDTQACVGGHSGMTMLADGVDEVRRAARNELRKGAHAIKIMASGGVASASDPISNLQYSEGEIRAVVEEASFWNTYVLAHAYTAKSIRRCVDFGVRSIEHANLIDGETAAAVAKAEAFVVPTLVAYVSMLESGKEMGMPEYSLRKLDDVWSAGLQSLKYLREAGVKMAFGTDLFGVLQPQQSREFLIRSEVEPAVDILRSATSVTADLLGEAGELGCVKAGALADLIVVDGNPLEDLTLLQDEGRHLAYIMKDGAFVKRLS